MRISDVPNSKGVRLRKRVLKSIRISGYVVLAASILSLVIPSISVAGTGHAVTFFQNDSPSDQTEAGQSSETPVDLLPFASFGYSNPGYTFADWSTTATVSVSSSIYTDGELYGFGSSMSLFAQWTPDVYTLTYNADGGVITPASVDYTVGSNGLTLADPAWTGYTFDGWNTMPDFTGVSYALGAVYTPAASVTLYAQWTPDVYTVTYNSEGATTTPAAATFTVGTSALTLPSVTLANNTFGDWNTAANGTGVSYAASVAFTPSSSLTLFAQWVPVYFTVTYNPEGGSVSPSSENFNVGSSALIIPSATLVGSTFDGWNLSANGSGTSFSVGALLTPTANVTLYAQWTVVSTVMVSFAANGGVGSISPLSGANGASVTLPGGTGLSEAGYTFASWNTSANGSGTVMNVGATLKLETPVTLYAQWDALLAPKSPDVLIGAVGSFANNSFSLSANLKTQIHRLAELTRAEHYSTETLYGYTSDTGSARTQMVVSDLRANAVATYLRQQLAALHVTGVKVISVGEGAVKAETAATYRRVEVFVKA